MTLEDLIKASGDDIITEDGGTVYPYKKTAVTPRLKLKWETGGARGGNCWGDSAEHYACNDGEPEFEALDALINAVCPDITFMQYKKLMRELPMDVASKTEDDYYGNYTEYSVKTVILEDLLKCLQSLDLVSC